MALVRRALEFQSQARDEDGEVDEIWCAFDVEWPENHPQLREAVALATSNGIRVAISNPCFELWLILHFRNQTAFMTNDQARKTRHECDGSRDQSLDGRLYMAHRSEAVGRAKALDMRHRGDRTAFPQDNPSSGMHRLVTSLTT